MRRALSRSALASVALILISVLPVGAQAPAGQITWGVPVSLPPAWFDPADATGILIPFMVYYALHDALVKPMPGNAMAPCLAESWSASPDGLAYDFTLRRAAKFHNGDPVTADDVKFSFERYRGVSAKMAVGIRTRMRALERAAYFNQLRDKKLRPLVYVASAAYGNAATRIDSFVSAGGLYAYGSNPDIEGLIQEQATARDRKRREETLHRIQQLMHERVMFAPVWDIAAMHAYGPRVAEPGFGLIGSYLWSGPYEDVTLKRP